MAQIILDSNNNLIQGDFDSATVNNRTKLQTTTTNATTNVYVVPNGSATSAGVSVANNSNLTNASKIVMATNGSTDTQIISGVNGSGTYLPLSFYTNNALAMQVDTAGNVGIGTSGPSTKLQVNGTITSVTAGSDICLAMSGANNAIRDTTNGSSVMYFDVSTGGTTNGAFVWRSSNAYTERMRITDTGEVWIAGTTDRGAFNLQCNGTGVWGAGAYTNGSDERIKQDITPLDTGLDVVAKLNPVTYKYKEDWSKDQSIQTGFIAQDLLVALEGKNYVDGIVNQSSEYMSVAYQNIIPILTKAIQEQQTIIQDLKARIETLEAK